MYDLILILHNFSRWLVLLAAIYVLYRSWPGLQSRTYTDGDKRAGTLYTSLMDVQLLLGIILLITSPLIRGAMGNFGTAMQASQTRFFLLEHWVVMVIAVVLAHVGSTRVKKAAQATQKHRQALIWYGIGLVLILLAIPWWRPLLRL
jgi:uncharacterized membrane protein